MPKLDITFDAIIADLPYGTTACSWDEVIPFDPLWENYKRLIKGNGAVVLFGSQPFTSKLVMSNLEWFKYEWIWEKDKSTGHLDVWKRPMKTHENLLVFYEKQSVYNPQIAKKPQENIRSNPNRKYSPPGEGVYGGFGKSRRTLPLDEKMPQSIVKVNVTNKRERGFHPTQKPIALLSYLIRTYTNSSEIILDNTMGSGTTLLAAQNEGRRAVGIELSEDYCKIAVERLRQPSFFSISDKPKPNPAKQLGLKLE
jgi:site-specific DNA-methyltransferase (adenine-specific)